MLPKKKKIEKGRCQCPDLKRKVFVKGLSAEKGKAHADMATLYQQLLIAEMQWSTANTELKTKEILQVF